VSENQGPGLGRPRRPGRPMPAKRDGPAAHRRYPQRQTRKRPDWRTPYPAPVASTAWRRQVRFSA